MAKIKKTISINAPVDQVFAFVSAPTNLPEIWPALLEVRDVKETPEGVGSSFSWVYKMAGMRFEGASETMAYIANQRNITKSTKGIPSTFDWGYEPAGGGTQVTLEVEYTVPVPLLGKLAEGFIVRQNEQEAECMLANLKARMEV